MDPVLAALEIVAEGVSVQLAQRLLERRRGQGRPEEITAQKVERMLKGTAARLGDVLQHEAEGIPEHEWNAAVMAVHDSLAAVAPVALDDALALELRPDRLDAHVRERAGDVRRAAGLSADGWSAYDRILSATCQQILRAIVALPEFTSSVQVATFQDLQDLRRTVDGLAHRPDPPGDPATGSEQDFERRYLDHVVRTLGRLELFGVSRGRAPRSRSLDHAYVSMAVARSGRRPAGEDDDELTGAGVDVAGAFREHRRILLRGGAGAGKTTLLRWLAVTAGREAQEAGGTGLPAAPRQVPFFVPLRQFAHRELPAPEDMPGTVAKVIAAETPPGWVSALFGSEHALLLVDGVDELEPVRAWRPGSGWSSSSAPTRACEAAAFDVPGVDLLAQITKEASEDGGEALELRVGCGQVQGVGAVVVVAAHEPVEVDPAGPVVPPVVPGAVVGAAGIVTRGVGDRWV